MSTATTEKIDFNFHVRPILSDKCFTCHGPDEAQRQAGLRLDTKEGAFAALTESQGFAIVSGDLDASELWHRIISTDPNDIMPPPEANLTLTENEINILKKWIEQGAEYQPHWSFIPPQSPNLPKVKNKDWTSNEIDFFTLSKMEEQQLSPNPKAEKAYLLKRVSLDLTGLPPSLELQKRFLNDNDPNAYEKIVDELLTSQHYGEKMAIHWLDVARYADSHGYQDDGLRTMWPWRDWVIHAFNKNYPYNKFLTMQLAGDLMPEKNKETILATGFNRNHKITQEGGVIDEEYRIEYVTDRTNTFGKAFLGMTFECAKCHDHKYDPISQEAYYSTFAFFNQVPEKGLFGTIDASFADPPNMSISDQDVQDILTFINKKDTATVQVMVMEDREESRSTFILDRGVYDAPTKKVAFQTPEAILDFDTTKFEQNRLGLSEWLIDEKNPLTSRVFVNRIWQEIFGRGIVKTSGDFGMQGELPSHPALLDWLAKDFQTNNWDIKRLIKKIVMSSTYQQSSVVIDSKFSKDPENIFLARAPRVRIPAELVRDYVLSASGLIHQEIGGPSVKPYQPEGIWDVATSGRGTLAEYIQDQGSDLYRRGMYTFIKRTVPPPKMLMFDASTRDQCEVRRLRTNTPLQALAMLNDPMVLEAARVFSETLMKEEEELSNQISIAFQKIICRSPKSKEVNILKNFYQEELSHYQKNNGLAKEALNVGEFPHPENMDLEKTATLMQVILAIFNMEEALIKG